MPRSDLPQKRYPFLTALGFLAIMSAMLFWPSPVSKVSHVMTDSYHWVMHTRVIEYMRTSFTHKKEAP